MSEDFSDLLGGEYLSSANVPQPLLLTITGADRVKLGKDERAVVQFAELPKRLLLNQTNLKMLVSLFTAKTEKWLGRKIVLFAAPCDFQGRTVQGLRLREPKTPQQAEPFIPPDLHEQAGDVPF